MNKLSKNIIKTIIENNHEAYFVGGCIRNKLLKKEIKDIDICTSATPSEIIDMFKSNKRYSIKEVGKNFGVIILSISGHSFEIATFRGDDYSNGTRKPMVELLVGKQASKYEFAIADMMRRDFTINAIFSDLDGNIHDFVDGMADIENRVIRTVGNPDDRFKEDPLRIMRAIRFSTLYGFRIEKNTYVSIVNNAELVRTLPMERIRDEFNKILLSDNVVVGLNTLYATGLLNVILPEINSVMEYNQNSKYHDKTLGEHLIDVCGKVKPILELRWAALLHDIGKPVTAELKDDGTTSYHNHDIISSHVAENICNRFKLKKTDTTLIKDLIANHMLYINGYSNYILYDIVTRFNYNIHMLFDLCMSDELSKTYSFNIDENNSKTHKLHLAIGTFIRSSNFVHLKDIMITNETMTELGINGKLYGIVLNKIHKQIINGKLKNEPIEIKKFAKMFAKDFMKKYKK